MSRTSERRLSRQAGGRAQDCSAERQAASACLWQGTWAKLNRCVALQGILPLPTDITYEGLVKQYFFDTSRWARSGLSRERTGCLLASLTGMHIRLANTLP